MPFLLLCGIGFSAMFGTISIATVATILLMTPFVSTFTVNEEPATRAQFLSFAAPILLAFLALAAAALGIVWALWKELPWSRPAILAFWLVGLFTLPGLALESGDAGDLRSTVATWGVLTACVWWYLYGKRTVVTYYRAISARHEQRGAAPPPPPPPPPEPPEP